MPATKNLSPDAKSALTLLFLVSFFNYMDRYVLSVLLPSIKADLALSDTQLGAIGTAFTISYVLLAIPFARMADQHNRKYVITAAVTIWSAMTAACGLAQSFIQLVIARIFVGVGEAGATPPSHSIISDYFPVASRAKAIAVFSLGAPVGIMVGFTTAGWLADHYSWRIAFLCMGLPGILLALLLHFKLKEPERGQSEPSETKAQADEKATISTAVKTLLSSPAYRHMCFATGLYTVVWLGVVNWLPSYFVRSFDMNMTQVGFWLAMSLGISQLIGMLASGALTDHLTKRNLSWYGWIPALAMFISTPLFIIVFQTSNEIVAAVALFPAFLIGVFQGPASLTGIQGIAHVRMRAMACAIFLLITAMVGGTLGPLLTGWLSDQLAASYGDDSLRQALLIVSIVFGIWAGIHYALSARTIAAEIRNK
jgi:MFS family permease